MKRISLSVLVVLALISIDATISMAYAKETIKIFKVTRVSSSGKLPLRAWPGPTSRIKVALPYNAKDLTGTGKKKLVENTKWVEVNWKSNKGWVKSRYLKKTGVLLRKTNTISSRNSKATDKTVQKAKRLKSPVKSLNDKPQEYGGDRYDQPTQAAATEFKTTFTNNNESPGSNKLLLCDGNLPKYWNIKMDVSDNKMQVKFADRKEFIVPINYHEWATPNKVRINVGGNKGRNVVDVNLEKTNTCKNGLTNTNYTYEVNATINRDFFSGCCEVVTK